MLYTHTPDDPKEIRLRREYAWCALGHRSALAFPGLPHAEAHSVKSLEALAEFAASRLRKNEVDGILVALADGWSRAVLMAAVETKTPFALVVPRLDGAGFPVEGSYGQFDFYRALAVETAIVSHKGDDGSAILTRDCWMVDRADNVMGLFGDVEDANEQAALAYTYAKDIGKRRLNGWKNWVKRFEANA